LIILKTITRKDVCIQISELLNQDPILVDDIINCFFDCFKESIVAGDKVELRNFGIFQMQRRAPKVGRILATNTPINIPAANYLSFKPGKEMKDKVNEK